PVESRDNQDYEPSGHYQYQNPQNYYNNNYQPPKKKKTKLIVGIIVICLAFIGTLTGAVIMMNQLIQNSEGGIVGTDDKIGTNSGPIAPVEIISQGAIEGVNDYSQLVDKVMPSIVAITQDYTQTYQSFWGESYGKQVQGNGSGFIVSQDEDELLIATNNHVVQGADKITVAFSDEETAEATVKGNDSLSDLAVISVKMSALKKTTIEKIKVAALGDSDLLKVGQSAIAIGNALGYGQSVTIGYISAKDREVTFQNDDGSTNTTRLLQTDAAINPGNSGGALLDANGNVIGINSGKYSSTEVEGMGYAIPISKAIPIINDIVERKVLKDEEKGYLGLAGKDVSKETSEAYGIPAGALVSEVAKGGAAEAAGIKVGDVIVKINDREVATVNDVQQLVNSYAIGTKVTVTLMRSDNGEYKSQNVTAVLKDNSTLDNLETVPSDNPQGGDGVPGLEDGFEGMFPPGDY
ncbi:MAG: trypsin-like peptidase domain-containing protein, partial [Lachnoclostridium sp.]|nr:trypsin-like peptidase domain-containing protein [Lachnoclostridium sp.]